MKSKFLIIGACASVLAACGNSDATSADPAALRGANFACPMNGVIVTLGFDANEMRAFGRAVNNYNGEYMADGEKIKFGPMATTMMMGPADAMAAEREYLIFLDGVETYSLSDGQLTLKNAEGAELVCTQVESTEDASAE